MRKMENLKKSPLRDAASDLRQKWRSFEVTASDTLEIEKSRKAGRKQSQSLSNGRSTIVSFFQSQNSKNSIFETSKEAEKHSKSLKQRRNSHAVEHMCISIW